MRVLKCSLQNFASYKNLDFDFENQGLTLIQGPTGSGKSTLCDAIPWVLFGRTAKDGAVDEVISWNPDSTQNAGGITHGHAIVQIKEQIWFIVRRRGQGRNDLFFYESGKSVEGPIRGKDLNDTQKIINNLLGIDSSLYLSGAYFHEFSQTAQFFTTTAKNRRAICEQLVDLSLAKTLQAKLLEQRKIYSGIEKSYAQKIQSYGDRIQYLARHNDYLEKSENFEQDKLAKLDSISTEINYTKNRMQNAVKCSSKINLDIQKAKKYLGNAICSECGGKKNSDEHIRVLGMEYEVKQTSLEIDKYSSHIIRLNIDWDKEYDSKNIYAELIEKMAKESSDATKTYTEYKSLLEATQLDLADIELLEEIVNDFRGIAIKNTIQSLEDQTNKLLTEHFDAEIRVEFIVEDADKLDVTITKDGNNCVYTQLSKGQRQLLKLAFGVSVMRTVANHHGVKFNCAFFDEAFDGMDDNFKARTFRLLEELALEYESVFVVEHNESIKSLFINKFSVELVSGASQIEKS